ncbi:MAG: flagellar basal body rod protein FlgC [Deltaproteobacteria bacterium]|nr:flagellar basal body rod protein FlgC [Deltaproteobacteria bacterium]
MSFMNALEIAASGLAASRTRMNVTAANVANANTTRGADGGPYKRQDPVLQAVPVAQPFGQMLRDRLSASLRGVQVTGVVQDQRAPRQVYDPSHPDADARGMVAMPNVNLVEEMVDMITASRAYEAGVTTIQTLKSMANKALSIGR